MAAQGVWVADGPNGSVEGIFTTELLASRHALDNGCAVMFWPFGLTREQAVEAERERRAKLVAKAPGAAKPKPKAVSGP